MIRGYYFVTDAGLSKEGIIQDTADALAAGVSTIQYRNKDAVTRQMAYEAQQLRALCQNATLIINDRIDIALAVDADGVHLGQDDMPLVAARMILGRKKLIGITVHTVIEAVRAEKESADYLGVSPVFATGTKRDTGPAAGVALIKDIRAACSVPLVAIGGITLENAASVIAAGADALCAISAVVTKDNVKKEVEKFQALFRK